MSASTRVVACPLCASPVEAPDGTPRVTCGICSSAIVLQDGSPILESDLERQKRRQRTGPPSPAPEDTAVTAVDTTVPVVDTTVPVVDTTVPVVDTTVPVVDDAAAVTSPDVPLERTSPDVPVEGAATSPGLPPPPDLGASLPTAPDLGSPPRTDSPLNARAFQGSLANLSIVDVLQLLYSAQKTGVLELTGPGVEASITLLQGQIIGCEHPTVGTQIGRTLVEMGAISAKDVEAALAKQSEAGKDRQPLVSTLIAMGKIDEQAGWNALEKLVESTVVNVLGWVGGSFVFEVSDVTAFDDFRHLPKGVTRVGLDTQTTLLGTLKAMDEHSRDGGDDDLDTTLLDNLDAAFADPHVPDVIDVSDEVEELHDTEEISVAKQKTGLPPQVAQAIARIRQTPPKILAAVGAGLLLVVIVIIVAVSVSGPDTGEPSEPTTDSTAVAPDEPATDAPATDAPATDAPATDAPATELEPESTMAPDEGITKTKKGKRKRKRRRKAKDARSLFDAAVK